MHKVFAHPVFRWLQHLVFWTCTYFAFVQVFKTGSHAVKVDYVYAALFQLTLAPAVYIHLRWLLPVFAEKRRWLLYVLLLAMLIALSVWINDRFFQDWSARLFPDYFFISYFSMWEISLFFVVYTGLSTLLKLSKSWSKANELQHQLVQVELKALKSQLNPHFLFNTLNGIYAMSLNSDTRLPDTVLRLSNLMRYFLYDTREELVPLAKEWEMIRGYVALQQLRSGEELDVKMMVEGDLDEQLVPPMLLITFLENAFKHGAKGNTGQVKIKGVLTLKPGRLHFELSNTQGSVDDIEPEDYRGLGLQNVRRRLELLYPQRHLLTVASKEDNFVIILEIEL